MIDICPPALVYIFFSISQILIDFYNNLYEEPFMKTIVMCLVSALLILLCKKGYSIVAWFIVLIPFLLMTVVITSIIYLFGYNTSTGKINQNYKTVNIDVDKTIERDDLGNILIYHPKYNSSEPVYYKHPYVIIPNNSKDITIYPPPGNTSLEYAS